MDNPDRPGLLSLQEFLRRNPTSNHIYSEVGYSPVADFDEFWFRQEGGE